MTRLPRRRSTLLTLLPLALASLSPAAMAQVAAPAGAVAAPARRAVPLASLPPLPPAVGAPALDSRISCPALQQQLASVLGGESWAWSISVADPQGRLLADVNGLKPRVPASNEKLVSTAFALDRLGPDHRLTTQLWRLPDGRLRLVGQGDPDLALPHLQRFAKLALNSGGSGGTAPGNVVLELAEEPAQAWWPAGWHPADRAYAYGAPVTRLAVTSNVIDNAVSNPPARLRTLLERSVASQGGSAQVTVVSSRQPLPQGSVLLHEEPSISMHGLLSLANTESHNFTAEVLLREAAGTWDLNQATRSATLWLQQQNLPMTGVRLADGSGLDRANLLTSRFLAALLLRMDQHPYARYYRSSMAVAGRRGTLRNLYNGSSLDGRFFGKTGTLTGVRSISGILQTSAGPRYVSAISNGAATPNGTIGQVLRQVQNTGICPLQ